MDLRSVLNSDANGGRGNQGERPASRPPAQPQPPTPQQQHPALPQQSPVSYPYREYSSGHHSSPGGAAEYPPSHQPGYQMPQSPYQQPPQQGAYGAARPAPPPLQPSSSSSFHDVTSPTGPSPGPYRPPGSASAPPPHPQGSTGYPFPSQEMTSPSMRHQYPPGASSSSYPPQRQTPQRQDSYGPGSAAYATQPSPVVATTPGPPGHHPYHASTPHAYGPNYPRGSPATQPRQPDFNRQPSQPSTPLAAPPAQRPVSSGHHHPYPQHPASPYQQRTPSVPVAQLPPQQAPQSSPPPPPPVPQQPPQQQPALPRPSLGQHQRDGSMSVSPKTRVQSISDLTADSMAVDRSTTPAKRKLEDRDLSPRELEHREPRPPPGAVNGEHRRVPSSSASATPAPAHASVPASKPEMRKKRVRYATPPIWAQSCKTLGKRLPKNANFVLQKRGAHVNGAKSSEPASAAPPSHHPTPERTKSRTSQPPPAAAAPAAAAAAAPAETGPRALLGAWEPSINGIRPYEEVTKMVADFLFVHVVNSEDMGEVRSREIKFEIEAKLGTLIDKDTNHRISRGIESEVVLQDNGRTAFRSSMTDVHHKAYNDFLNQAVIQTDPRSGSGRVQVQYAHRREIDRFIELPNDLQARIPGCMRSRLGSRARNVRVRLTYDQKSGEVLGKIIKARVADFDIHLPSCPMDCRISVNLEMDWDGPVAELEQLYASQNDHARNPDRNKDRLSYKHGPYQIDLTQVTQQHQAGAGNPRLEKEHELEIELNPDLLIDQGRRALEGADHRYPELVEGFVDNVRVMARKARDFH